MYFTETDVHFVASTLFTRTDVQKGFFTDD